MAGTNVSTQGSWPKWILLLLATGVLASGVRGRGGFTPSSTQIEVGTNSVPIFNGTDLTGWTIYGTQTWRVENGELVGESAADLGEGYLATISSYKDFDLTLDFKQETNGNSGVYFRSVFSDGAKISGWQAEVAQPGHDTGRIFESYGRGWISPSLTPAQQAALLFGEWNTFRLRVVGEHVQTWLNGIAIADTSDVQIGAATGIVALQIGGGSAVRVRWRNLLIDEVVTPICGDFNADGTVDSADIVHRLLNPGGL